MPPNRCASCGAPLRRPSSVCLNCGSPGSACRKCDGSVVCTRCLGTSLFRCPPVQGDATVPRLSGLRSREVELEADSLRAAVWRPRPSPRPAEGHPCRFA